MDREKEIENYVKNELSASSHDMEHTFRVMKIALKIAKSQPNADVEVIKIAALLHDIARVKEDSDPSRKIDHSILGAEIAENILRKLNYSEDFIKNVTHCIRSHRFRGNEKPETIEAKILSDADKLDALGAVGIGRAFMIAGEWGEPLYKEFKGIEEYISGNTINGRVLDQKEHSPNIEFEVKLKKIPERLFTDEAKSIARERLTFMEKFFKRIEQEINGEN